MINRFSSSKACWPFASWLSCPAILLSRSGALGHPTDQAIESKDAAPQ